MNEYRALEYDRPASVHAEMTILGAMLVDQDAMSTGIDKLQPGDFSLDSNRQICSAIVHVHREGQGVDLVTVAEYLRRKKFLDSVGGVSYLALLSEGLPRKLNIESYIRIVRDKSIRRAAQLAGERIVAEASDESEGSSEFLERTIGDLQELSAEQDDRDLERIGIYIVGQDATGDTFDNLATRNGIHLGFTQWDEVTGGMQPGDLIIIAARPSMGKTAWACSAAHHTAIREGKTTVLFSMEMKREAIVRRMLSAAARVDYKDIREGNLRSHERALILEHRQQLAAAPLYIHDQHGLTVTHISAKCRRLQRTAGLDIVFIDQLSKISGSDVYQRGMQLREVIGKQTAALKKMAQELNVPVVVFNQLSRESGKRTDNKPRLEDLKESGNIEEDADVVGLLHRPEYYDKADESLRGKGQMIIAKQREGETKTCECTYTGRIMRWEDAAPPLPKQEDLNYYNPYR